VLFLAQMFLHSVPGGIVDRWIKNYGPSGKQGAFVMSQVDPTQILVQLFGFREFLAGILWVRADGFFDDGNYDAVLPIIRLCTLLDPKEVDIYATGMWHIAYNFTDDEQRSDRRYVASALALGKEGAAQNNNTYELFFETGWIWYHKIDDDYPQAVKWFKEAAARDDIIPARRHLLAHAYEKNDQIKEALDLYDQLLKEAETNYAKDKSFYNLQERDTVENNMDNLIVRMVQRGWLAQKRGDYDKGEYDTKPPFDVGFSARVTVDDPKVLHFVGTWNVLPVGTRIRVILRDENYPGAKPAELDWDARTSVDLEPSKTNTYMQDQLYVKNRRFDRRCDLSKDVTMYPFNSRSQRYTIEFYWNPRSAPAHMQDKFGWNGEGMADANFLNTNVRPGQRVIYTTLTLTRDQIFRRGEWANKVPIVQTANYKAEGSTATDDHVINIPALRGEEAPQKLTIK